MLHRGHMVKLGISLSSRDPVLGRIGLRQTLWYDSVSEVKYDLV